MAEQKIEMTFRAIVISIVLTVILAATNTYLSLKIGILPSASIPAAIISMSILRFFRNYNILENNLIQTTASAGQAVVGGIVYTVPSLVIIKYWFNFPYWQCFFMAFLGGVLGVLFSIPLRKKLVRDPQLPFPEGKAIAAVLRVAENNNINMRKVVSGGIVGALINLFQSGFKLIAEDFQCWFAGSNAIAGLGAGFSAAMIGTGYLIGFDIGLSLLLGGVLSWVIGMPLLSSILGFTNMGSAAESAMAFWSLKLRYISIGAMICAGLVSFFVTIRPSFSKSISINNLSLLKSNKVSSSESDLPNSIIMICLTLTLAVLFILFTHQLELIDLQLDVLTTLSVVSFLILYIVIIGFVFAAMCGYFSGLLGVSGSPGSGIIIVGALLIAVLFNAYISLFLDINMSQSKTLQVEAIIILVTSIIACISAVSCDNIQDLKVGHIIGATPWKQQIMLLLGILVAAAVIPLIMQLLFDVYGISGASNRAGIDPGQTLPAPPAAMIASLVDSVFNKTVPWELLGIGAGLIGLFIFVYKLAAYKGAFKFSIIAVATGMYLPLTTTVPLFIGSLLSASIKKQLEINQSITVKQKEDRYQFGFLIASGLLCGAALMEVALACIFAWYRNSNVLQLVPDSFVGYSIVLACATTIALFLWIYAETTGVFFCGFKKTAPIFRRRGV